VCIYAPHQPGRSEEVYAELHLLEMKEEFKRLRKTAMAATEIEWTGRCVPEQRWRHRRS
jgi:hypothetical protein